LIQAVFIVKAKIQITFSSAGEHVRLRTKPRLYIERYTNSPDCAFAFCSLSQLHHALGRRLFMPTGQDNPRRSHRRQAMQLVMQLPLEPGEALAILDEARSLIVDWVERQESAVQHGGSVIDTSAEVVPWRRSLPRL
jgi:hypothetical protein